jgi:hypothetical protein
MGGERKPTAEEETLAALLDVLRRGAALARRLDRLWGGDEDLTALEYQLRRFGEVLGQEATAEVDALRSRPG